MEEPDVEPRMRERVQRWVTTRLRTLREPKRAMISAVALATFVILLLAVFVGGTRLWMLFVLIAVTEAILWRRHQNKDYEYEPRKSRLQPSVRIHRLLNLGEIPERNFRKHPAALFFEGKWWIPPVGAVVLTIIGETAAFRSTNSIIPSFIVGFIAMFFLRALVKLPRWLMERYCLTPHRLMMTKGIINHSEPQVALRRFVDRKPTTPWHSHLLYTLGIISAEYGTIEEETAGPNEDVKDLDKITYVPRVYDICRQLSRFEFGEARKTDDPDGT